MAPRAGCSAAFPFPRLPLVESAHELPAFLPPPPPPPADAADGSACACPRDRLLLPSAAAMRCPSCGRGPDLVLIRLRPSEDARMGDSAAADAPPGPHPEAAPRRPSSRPPTGSTRPTQAPPAPPLEAADPDAEPPKSLSRFLGSPDLGFFLSDLDDDDDDAAAGDPPRAARRWASAGCCSRPWGSTTPTTCAGTRRTSP